MRKANVIISVVLLAFIAFYAYQIIKLPDRNLPNTVGGDFIPWLLTIFLLFLTVLLLLHSLLGKGEEAQVKKTSWKNYGGILLLFVIMILYIRGMLYFGYLIATPIFMAIMMRMTGSKRVREIVIYSVLTTLGVYILFSRVFEVALPEGKFF